MSGHENIFADHVQGRPALAKFRRLVIEFFGRIVSSEADVITESVEPYIIDVIAVKGELDAPAQSRFRSRNAQVRAGLAIRAGLPVAA